VREFLTPRNLLKIIGWRGLGRIIGSKMRRPSGQPAGDVSVT
jgi:hypothetical protein